VRSDLEIDSSISGQLRRIGAIEREIAALQAEQVRRAGLFVREREELDARQGCAPGSVQWTAMVAEIAVARGISTLSAASWLDDAFTLDDTAPYTLDALARGDISLWSARAIAGQLKLVEDIGLRRLADEVIAEEAAGLLPGKIKTLAETRIIDLDPSAADARAVQARKTRNVTCTPGEVGTGLLTATLPIEQAVACWNALHDQALTEYAAGDPDGRKVSHLMSDLLVERLTGQTKAGEVKTQVNLVMDSATLLGLDDKPGQILGMGPIPPGVARMIAATGDSWVTRLFTDPVDGSVLLADSRSRRFYGALRKLIRLSVQHCRGPACLAKIVDFDHLDEYHRGGRTKRVNGQGLSKGCHRMRDHPQVTVTRDPQSNAVTWTLPSGQRATTLPPPALGYGTSDRAEVLIRDRLSRRHSRQSLETRLIDTVITLRRSAQPGVLAQRT
jgi:hypothetical protein